jgi:hypothetical protein
LVAFGHFSRTALVALVQLDTFFQVARFSFFFSDARFFASSSSTYYADKRLIAATHFWQSWYNQTLFSNRPHDLWSSIPRGGHGFESTPTVGWSYRTDSQFSVEESAATPVYFQTSYGKAGNDRKSLCFVTKTIVLETRNCV